MGSLIVTAAIASPPCGPFVLSFGLYSEGIPKSINQKMYQLSQLSFSYV